MHTTDKLSENNIYYFSSHKISVKFFIFFRTRVISNGYKRSIKCSFKRLVLFPKIIYNFSHYSRFLINYVQIVQKGQLPMKEHGLSKTHYFHYFQKESPNTSKGTITSIGLSKTHYFQSIESKYNDFNTLNTTSFKGFL